MFLILSLHLKKTAPSGDMNMGSYLHEACALPLCFNSCLELVSSFQIRVNSNYSVLVKFLSSGKVVATTNA